MAELKGSPATRRTPTRTTPAPDTTSASPYYPLFITTDVAGLGCTAQVDAPAAEQFWTRMITFLNRLSWHQGTLGTALPRIL